MTDGSARTGRPIALITGATRGIGRAVADALAPTHHLLLGGRDEQALTDLTAALPSAEPFHADLTDAERLARAVAGIDRLHVLVHSAGIYHGGTVEETALADWRRSFEVNVFGVAELTRLLLPALRAARGRVVAINSGSGYSSGPGGAVYSGSKFALRALTDALREEERAHGVQVISVHPGRVDTDMQHELVAYQQGTYDPEKYLRPPSVAAAVRLAIDLGEDAMIEDLSIRPARR